MRRREKDHMAACVRIHALQPAQLATQFRFGEWIGQPQRRKAMIRRHRLEQIRETLNTDGLQHLGAICVGDRNIVCHA